MSFIPAKKKTMDEYLLGTHTDHFSVWASVHDEVDLAVLKYLRNPIMKLVTSLASLKDLLDKYKLPGLSMSYDVEYDDHLSWTAGKAVDIYKYPTHENERVMYDLWEQSKEIQLRPNVEAAHDGRVIQKKLSEVNKDFLEMLSKLPNGKDKIVILTGEDQMFEYERLVEYPDNM